MAAAQRGVVTYEQLLVAGLSPRTVQRWLATRRLHRLHRGVYLLGHAAMAPLASELAAVLACGPGALLSHRSAAALWAIARYSGPAHVTTAAGQRRNRDGLVVHRARSLRQRDAMRHQGIPVTAPARTLLDLTEVAAPRETERAYDEALTRRLITPHAMRVLLERSPGRRGAPLIAALLKRDHGTTLAHPGAEELMLALVREALLPTPEVNARAAGFEIDFLWRRQRVAAEIDSFAWHGKSAAAFHRDHDKTAALEAAGFTVVRITWRQLTEQRLATAARLARTLAAAGSPPCA